MQINQHPPKDSLPPIEIDDDIYVPPGLKSDPRFIVPDSVVTACAEAYGLPGLRGIDPMCGVGTVPRVIAAMGGTCDAIEIDPEQVAVAKAELPAGANVIQGDCTEVKIAELYDYVYTSLPFRWFEFYPEGLSDAFARAFRGMLKAGGVLIVDADDIARRDGRSWPLAESEIDYFTKHGFRFDECRRFVLKAAAGKGDATFTELKFSLPE